jgi:hypothetical protein
MDWLSWISDEIALQTLRRSRGENVNAGIDEAVDAVVGVDKVGLGENDVTKEDRVVEYGISQRYREEGLESFIFATPQGSSPIVATVVFDDNPYSPRSSRDESPIYQTGFVEETMSSDDGSDPEFSYHHYTDVHVFGPHNNSPTTPPSLSTSTALVTRPHSYNTRSSTRELIPWSSDSDSHTPLDPLETLDRTMDSALTHEERIGLTQAMTGTE